MEPAHPRPPLCLARWVGSHVGLTWTSAWPRSTGHAPATARNTQKSQQAGCRPGPQSVVSLRQHSGQRTRLNCCGGRASEHNAWAESWCCRMPEAGAEGLASRAPSEHTRGWWELSSSPAIKPRPCSGRVVRTIGPPGKPQNVKPLKEPSEGTVFFPSVEREAPEIRLSCYMKKPGWLNRNTTYRAVKRTRLEAQETTRMAAARAQERGKILQPQHRQGCWGRDDLDVLETQDRNRKLPTLQQKTEPQQQNPGRPVKLELWEKKENCWCASRY